MWLLAHSRLTRVKLNTNKFDIKFQNKEGFNYTVSESLASRYRERLEPEEGSLETVLAFLM